MDTLDTFLKETLVMDSSGAIINGIDPQAAFWQTWWEQSGKPSAFASPFTTKVAAFFRGRNGPFSLTPSIFNGLAGFTPLLFGRGDFRISIEASLGGNADAVGAGPIALGLGQSAFELTFDAAPGTDSNCSATEGVSCGTGVSGKLDITDDVFRVSGALFQDLPYGVPRVFSQMWSKLPLECTCTCPRDASIIV